MNSQHSDLGYLHDSRIFIQTVTHTNNGYITYIIKVRDENDVDQTLEFFDCDNMILDLTGSYSAQLTIDTYSIQNLFTRRPSFQIEFNMVGGSKISFRCCAIKSNKVT